MIKRTGRLRLIRTADLAELRTAAAELTELRPLLAQAQQSAELATDSAIRTETTAETLREELARAITAAARAEGELTALRVQHLLDAEDRVALRMLLRTARKQQTRTGRVYVLYRHGALHSVHTTRDAAEIAAEAEGAPRDGWTSSATCCATPYGAPEAPWRIQTLPLGGGER
ncbi:hypothetical protein OOK39_46080 [Streptomyces sp. NBC_00264]|uniref:hypothetical protein n=1 Tax=unclassified Streptomyces TaxID=2593676 RepID=UPI00225B28F1|nr:MULTISPECIES: hypothetical protein [unclassified Streptomyces]MCX5166387.1 hypothetical protein [Streptomyces sp. NBC_00305]MCX5166408.1 hypothetical protein [Streptomyces sp. NBC_00305]MCX5224905.1 hypothetical protein [Streptomyces sp. NBC_00264]